MCLAPELSNCKWRWGGDERGGGGGVKEMEERQEQREAYWGQQRALLSVISIQMRRIRCSECGAAQGWKLVLFRTQPWSRQGQIQTNEFTQTIRMERRQCRSTYEWQKDVKQRRPCLSSPSNLLPLFIDWFLFLSFFFKWNTKQLSAFYFPGSYRTTFTFHLDI